MNQKHYTKIVASQNSAIPEWWDPTEFFLQQSTNFMHSVCAISVSARLPLVQSSWRAPSNNTPNTVNDIHDTPSKNPSN